MTAVNAPAKFYQVVSYCMADTTVVCIKDIGSRLPRQEFTVDGFGGLGGVFLAEVILVYNAVALANIQGILVHAGGGIKTNANIVTIDGGKMGTEFFYKVGWDDCAVVYITE